MQAAGQKILGITLKSEFDKIASLIQGLIPSSKVILFGSYAKDTQTDESDLDLCVLVPKLDGSRLDMILIIRDAICDIMDLPLDVLVYTFVEFEENAHLKSTLQYVIKNEGMALNV